MRRLQLAETGSRESCHLTGLGRVSRTLSLRVNDRPAHDGFWHGARARYLLNVVITELVKNAAPPDWDGPTLP